MLSLRFVIRQHSKKKMKDLKLSIFVILFVTLVIFTPTFAQNAENQTKPVSKFAVGEIVDLQSNYVETYWHKAEIVEIIGGKYKVRKVNNNNNKSTEIVSELKLRPFTTPVKYEIGQKVEVMDKGVWYKGEIMSIQYGFYGIRFDGTTNRSDRFDLTEEFMRPLNSASTAQTKQEYSSPLWMQKFGISERQLTEKMLANASKDYEGCTEKYNTLLPPDKLETSSERAFSTESGSSGEENKFLLTYAIGNANLARIKGINLKTSKVGYTKPQSLAQIQETDENTKKINLKAIRLVFKGSDSYQISAEPNDDYIGIIKFVCNGTKSTAATANLTIFYSETNASSTNKRTAERAETANIPSTPSATRAYNAAMAKYENLMAYYNKKISEMNRINKNSGSAAGGVVSGPILRDAQNTLTEMRNVLNQLLSEHGGGMSKTMRGKVEKLLSDTPTYIRSEKID